MRKHTSVADATPLRVVIVTLDSHLACATERARQQLSRELPGLALNLHAAAEWADDAESLERCLADIAAADIVFANMLFMEDHIQPVLSALQARRDGCDAMIGCMSAAEVVKLTRLGGFKMDGSQKSPLAFLKRLRGKPAQPGADASAGAKQMATLRRLPQILRYIPGTAQDVRAYFLTLQYWLAGSEENIVNLVRFLVDRYADGPRRHLRGKLKSSLPIEYPDVGLYHPRIKGRISDRLEKLPAQRGRGRVGLLVMRSYVLAGNTRHFDGVIDALEAKGLDVVPAFASGLDARPAVETYFLDGNRPTIDAVVSLSGFSLVGGPAYNDAKAAEELLTRLDVPYIAAQAVEFQSLDQWSSSERGLLPVEATMMVAIPEIDGATGPMVFGGRTAKGGPNGRDMTAHEERAQMLASRVDRLVTLRRTAQRDRKIAIVLFNFPPNTGSTGTAAYLSVFASLHRTLQSLADAGYSVEVPASIDELRERILTGNASRYGAPANVHVRLPSDEHVRRERWLEEIEAAWGPAPGRQQTDGASLFVLGERFGNVFVGIQPSFGYEGDPMRLLFERGFAPTHAFSAFYRFIREDFCANAVLHFGTHGALEFMPGKQVGLSQACWPDRLIGELPNFYLYAANNPSEGTIAKRRAAATLISYLTPPVTHAGLYRGLADLKASIERFRALSPDAAERDRLVPLIRAQALELELASQDEDWADPNAEVARLFSALIELETTLIPHGLHVIGQPPSRQERIDLLAAMVHARGLQLEPVALEAIVDGASAETALKLSKSATTDLAMIEELSATAALLSRDYELPALLHALDAGFVRPTPGGDLLRTPSILPTGRNVHGFDPFRLPSSFAVTDGARQAQRIIEKHRETGAPLPESIALVLWGTDNLKTEGSPIAQALALIGAKPRFDSYGRLCGAELVPLESLGRPRIDVVVTLSGIFRDLLPLQTKLLAEASYLAATADEPDECNFVRKHALAYQRQHGGDLETAALRVFSNADGAYGSNVNQLIDSSCWQDEDELAEVYTRRKGYAYGRGGKAVPNPQLLNCILRDVQLAYQNLDSVEVGITTVDHYFDTLGGISRAISRAKGATVPVYIGDQTSTDGAVRTLEEQVAIETRTRMLNPKWYEEMLQHGYEGVHQIEAHITNTMGWSATTGQVSPWVYQQLTQTFVLDAEMRNRLAALNPMASVKVANRLLEAHQRRYWSPDESMLEALRRASDALEDQLEGVTEGVAA